MTNDLGLNVSLVLDPLEQLLAPGLFLIQVAGGHAIDLTGGLKNVKS